MFLFFLFLLTTPGVFGQSQTNALPNLLPPLAPMPPSFRERYEIAIVAGVVILIALIAAGIWKILKPGPQPVMPPVAVAREALAKYAGRPEDGKVLSEVSQALRRYVGAVSGSSAGELTTEEFRHELARSEKIGAQLKNDISDFLRTCDERKFSSTPSTAPLNAVNRALEFISLIEEDIRKRDDAHVNNK
jgi:hypothetical protein